MQTKEQIKNYMLKLISERDGELVSKTVKYFGKSKSTVYNYLTQMQEDGIIFKAEGGFELVTKLAKLTNLRPHSVFSLLVNCI